MALESLGPQSTKPHIIITVAALSLLIPNEVSMGNAMAIRSMARPAWLVITSFNRVPMMKSMLKTIYGFLIFDNGLVARYASFVDAPIWDM